jgi:hypothetical protein
MRERLDEATGISKVVIDWRSSRAAAAICVPRIG